MRWRLPFLGEFLFLLVALVSAMTAALVVISGINPLENTAMLVVGATSVVVLGGHHVWYARHRDEIEHDPGRLSARERRGY